jgi:hypothetical protein
MFDNKKEAAMRPHIGLKAILTASLFTSGCAMFRNAQPPPQQLRLRQVHLEFQVVEVDNSAIAPMSSQPLFTFPSITQLIKEKHAAIVHTIGLATSSGVQATVKGVLEFIYPTEFAPSGKDEQTINVNVSATTGAVLEPVNFGTRDVGLLLTVLPEVSGDPPIVNLTLTPEWVSDPTWQSYAQNGQIEDGASTNAVVKQPVFPTQSLSATVAVRPGVPTVLSACPRHGTEKTTVVLVCAWIQD